MTPTKRQLAARHVRRLRTIRQSILQMSGQWEDCDQYCVNELERLADMAEEIAVNLIEEEA